MNDEAKRVLCAVELFLQDVAFAPREEKSFYLVEDLAVARGELLAKFADRAEDLRLALESIYQEHLGSKTSLVNDTYGPGERIAFERAVEAGEFDDEIEGLGQVTP